MHWYNYCCIKYKLNKFQLFIKSKWLNDGILLVFSPRMWRWSWVDLTKMVWEVVFSTYVEVILKENIDIQVGTSFLHVCGGDPSDNPDTAQFREFSPRMWRWSSCSFSANQSQTVFSTYVEVILFKSCKMMANQCFLHVCGGDPMLIIQCEINPMFSPRMWRWSYELCIC